MEAILAAPALAYRFCTGENSMSEESNGSSISTRAYSPTIDGVRLSPKDRGMRRKKIKEMHTEMGEDQGSIYRGERKRSKEGGERRTKVNEGRR